jgi:hypothetical protein
MVNANTNPFFKSLQSPLESLGDAIFLQSYDHPLLRTLEAPLGHGDSSQLVLDLGE